MGRNYKEKAAYHYLHDIKSVPRKMMIKLFKKWNRHNFDIDEMRYNRVMKKEHIFDRDWKKEIGI